MPYYLSRLKKPHHNHPYRRIVHLEKAKWQGSRLNGYIDPIEAAASAVQERKDWGFSSARFVVESNKQVLLASQLESKLNRWAKTEYESLKKCRSCLTILEEEGLYCSALCEEQHSLSLGPMDDNEETEDYL